MSVTALRPWTEEAFFAWLQGQRLELVDGAPRAMVGATLRHNRIVGNLMAALREGLRGGRCIAYAQDVAVRMPVGNIRTPDVVVDCGAYEDRALAAVDPTFVAEVFSPRPGNSTRWRSWRNTGRCRGCGMCC